MGGRTPPPRRRSVRIVAISDGQATAEDLVLDPAETAARLGDTAAALIFDDTRPGTLDLTHATAVARYGTQAAALIFPSDAAVAGAPQHPTPPI